MSNLIKFRSVHSSRLERWLGADKVREVSGHMKDWYGPPIHLLDCPGSVRVCKDGDFIGPFSRGVFMSALDALGEAIKRAGQVPRYSFNAGFTSISDALERARQGHLQHLRFRKQGTAGVVGFGSSFHKQGQVPVAGVTASAAPGGIAYVQSDTGGMHFVNPSVGTLRLTGASADNAAAGTILIYDRIFGVDKTMASTATESVTGVPTRYQSTTATAEDYAGGNFLFIENGTTQISNTAHNWTVCLYRDDANNDAQTLPSIAGRAQCPIHDFDMATGRWFCPLASGDVGIMDLNQMQCSASLAAGDPNFVIGHPIGFMNWPLLQLTTPFDWLTNRELAPRVFDDAYLAFLEPPKPSTSTTRINGYLELTSTSS